MKHFCLLTPALVLSASAASAGLSFNGLSFNGLSFNGLSFNGASLNGAELNGSSGREMPKEGEVSEDATVVVQALTLVDGTQLTVVSER